MASENNAHGSTKAAIKAQIDENLKRAYNEALTAEIPDRFTELLRQLRAKEGAK